MKLVFIHGGPGFNSNPEINILSELYAKNNIEFIAWNEPSLYRGVKKENLSFENTVQSLGEFLESIEGEFTLMAHSFAINFILPHLTQYKTKIKKLVLVSPALDIYHCDENIIDLAIKDFKNSGESSEQVTTLENFIKDNENVFDAKRSQALLTATTDPLLFTHYFHQKEIIPTYFSYFQDEFQVDMDEFMAVRQTYTPFNQSIDLDVTVVTGKYDPIVDIDNEMEHLSKIFSKVELVEFEEAAHYPHIEQKENLLQLL